MPKLDPVESLVLFAEEVKPYHTKILDVTVEYIHKDALYVRMSDKIEWFHRVELNSPPGTFFEDPGIHLQFDRAVLCDEGFGHTAMGTIHPTQEDLATNVNYNTSDGDYRADLDRNNPEYDPGLFLESPISATSTELAVSTPFINYLAANNASPYIGIESYWDNTDCPIPSECMVIPFIIEDVILSTNIVMNAFCNNFHQTFDTINGFNFEFGPYSDCRYPTRVTQIIQDDYAHSPPIYGVAKAYYYMDYGQWFWEIKIDSYTGLPADLRVGILEFDPLDHNLPFGVTNNTTPLGNLTDHVGLAGNGDLFVGGVQSVGYTPSFGQGDIIGVAFDVDSNTIQFYINGTAAGAQIIAPINNANVRGIFPSDPNSPSWTAPLDSPGIDYKVYSPGVSMKLDNTQTTITILAEENNIVFDGNSPLLLPFGFSVPEAGGDCPDPYLSLSAPVLVEVIPVPAFSNNHYPQYTFSTDRDGTIEYGGVGVGDLINVVIGNNLITYDFLPPGTYNNFTISVTSNLDCQTATLDVNLFVIGEPQQPDLQPPQEDIYSSITFSQIEADSSSPPLITDWNPTTTVCLTDPCYLLSGTASLGSNSYIDPGLNPLDFERRRTLITHSNTTLYMTKTQHSGGNNGPDTVVVIKPNFVPADDGIDYLVVTLEGTSPDSGLFVTYNYNGGVGSTITYTAYRGGITSYTQSVVSTAGNNQIEAIFFRNYRYTNNWGQVLQTSTSIMAAGDSGGSGNTNGPFGISASALGNLFPGEVLEMVFYAPLAAPLPDIYAYLDEKWGTTFDTNDPTYLAGLAGGHFPAATNTWNTPPIYLNPSLSSP